MDDDLCRCADERVLVTLGDLVRLVALTPIGLPAEANKRHCVHGEGVKCDPWGYAEGSMPLPLCRLAVLSRPILAAQPS